MNNTNHNYLFMYCIIFTAMWSASFYIGNCIGPTVAGILVDAYGFHWTTSVFLYMFCFIIFVDTCELIYYMFSKKQKSDIDIITIS